MTLQVKIRSQSMLSGVKNLIQLIKFLFLHYYISFIWHLKELTHSVKYFPLYDKPKFDKKIIVLSGGTSGIGYQVAKYLYLIHECDVIVVSNQPFQGEKMVFDLKQQALYSNKGKISYHFVNLNNTNSIKELVNYIKTHYVYIDVLINNAGMFDPYIFDKVYSNSHLSEKHINTNFLGPTLLTYLMLPLLKNSPNTPSRVVNTSSVLHYIGTPNAFDNPPYLPGHAYYASSKLALTTWTNKMSQILSQEINGDESKKIIINCCHPGIIYTPGLYNHFCLPIRWTVILLAKFHLLKTPQDGAQTILYLALSHDVQNISGCYFENSQLAPLPKAALNSEFQSQIMNVYESNIRHALLID